MNQVQVRQGFCGQELKVKEWKQGTSVSCEKIDTKVVSYPNNGLRHAISKFCNLCRESPYYKKEDS